MFASNLFSYLYEFLVLIQIFELRIYNVDSSLAGVNYLMYRIASFSFLRELSSDSDSDPEDEEEDEEEELPLKIFGC